MKSTFKFTFLFMVVLFIFSCHKEENDTNDYNLTSEQKEVLFDFLKSNDFRNLPYEIKDINKELTTVHVIDVEGNYVPIIYVFFGLDKNNPKGLLKAIKLTDENSKRKVLPNNNDFAMLYINLNDFNFTTKSGGITISDVNYDNFVFLTSKIENSKVVDEIFNRVDSNIFVKYGYFKPSITQKTVPDSCHGGTNGDVSWSECMHCLKSICYSSPDCFAIDIAVDVLSTVSGRPPLGTLSYAAACVYISAVR